MELFNKVLFLSQQKMFALTHRRVYTLMVNLFQILNQFVLLFRKNVIEKSSMIWRVLPLVKINTRISETPCIFQWNWKEEEEEEEDELDIKTFNRKKNQISKRNGFIHHYRYSIK
jgi:uncharacterized protein involved in tolerance to divalent cations